MIYVDTSVVLAHLAGEDMQRDFIGFIPLCMGSFRGGVTRSCQRRVKLSWWFAALQLAWRPVLKS